MGNVGQTFRLRARLRSGVLALLFAGCVACTSATDRPDASQPGPPALPAQPAPAVPAQPALPEGPDSLSGTWKLVMGKMTWNVPLAPRPGLPGEYLGVGQRETPDEQGKPVTMDVGAVKEGDDFRAWLGMGVIKCKGRFRRSGQIKGDCIEMGGNPAGPFVAERE